MAVAWTTIGLYPRSFVDMGKPPLLWHAILGQHPKPPWVYSPYPLVA